MASYKDEQRGTWYALIRYTDENSKPKSKIKRGFKTKREAKAFETQFRAELVDESPSNTVDSLFDLYLETVKSSTKEETRNGYRRLKKAFFNDIGSVKIDKLKQSRILEVSNDIKNSDYSRRYKNDGLRLLRTILRFSNDLYNTRFNLIHLKSIPLSVKDYEEPKVWTLSEFEQFIKHLDREVYKVFFTFLFKTGARRGEAMALTWSDIKGQRVTINKTLRSKRKGVQDTKTVSSIRDILITDELLKQLSSIRHGLYVFGGDYPLGATQIEREFKKGLQRSGVEKIRIHDLRHSHATHLINSGANIVAVSKRLGHSSTSMTLKVYTHLLEDTEVALLEYL